MDHIHITSASAFVVGKAHCICSSHFFISQVFTADYVIAYYHLLQEVFRTNFDVQILLQYVCDILKLIKSAQQSHATASKQLVCRAQAVNQLLAMKQFAFRMYEVGNGITT